MDQKRKDDLFEAACLREQLEKKSFSEYVWRAARVRRVSGLPLGYPALVRYFRLQSSLKAGTLRSTKSAVLFILRMGGRPMSLEDSERLDDILDGLECATNQPEKVRGAPTATQVRELIAEAYRVRGADDGLALVVAHGAATRANELVALESED